MHISENTINIPAAAKARKARNGEDAANRSGYHRYINRIAMAISSRHFRLISFDIHAAHIIWAKTAPKMKYQMMFVKNITILGGNTDGITLHHHTLSLPEKISQITTPIQVAASPPAMSAPRSVLIFPISSEITDSPLFLFKKSPHTYQLKLMYEVTLKIIRYSVVLPEKRSSSRVTVSVTVVSLDGSSVFLFSSCHFL